MPLIRHNPSTALQPAGQRLLPDHTDVHITEIPAVDDQPPQAVVTGVETGRVKAINRRPNL